MSGRLLLSVSLLVCTLGHGAAAAAPARDLWPLDPGGRWVLESESGLAGDLVLRVVARSGGWSALDGPLGRLWLWASPRTGRIYVWEPVARRALPWLDLGADRFSMALPGWRCLDASAWRVRDRAAEIDTPLGRFRDCVVIERQGAAPSCGDVPLVRLALAPGIGPVLWERAASGQRERFVLAAAEVGGRPVPAQPAAAIASPLPERFDLRGEGVGGPVDLEARRIVLVQRGAPRAGEERLARLARRLLALDTPPAVPAGVPVQFAIYELRSPHGLRFWAGNGSGGQRTRAAVYAALDRAIPPAQPGCTGFAPKGTLRARWLGTRSGTALLEGARALTALLGALTDDAPDRATPDVGYAERGCRVGEFGTRWLRAAVIDPTALSGPEPHAYVLVWTGGREE
ncbi:MAG: hypothetical protein D6776_07130 [Planctomycetota bacterium]|nr:MAG: hypothetical protein D6776_07130 [Planctomycetota bacterium]